MKLKVGSRELEMDGKSLQSSEALMIFFMMFRRCVIGWRKTVIY